MRLLLVTEEALEDRLGDSSAVHRVRSALDALSQLLHCVHRTILGRERWGRTGEPFTSVASRTRHPDSRHVSGIQHRHVSGIVVRRTTVHGVIAPPHAAAPRGSERTSRANTTILFAAEYSGWHAERINRS